VVKGEVAKGAGVGDRPACWDLGGVLESEDSLQWIGRRREVWVGVGRRLEGGGRENVSGPKRLGNMRRGTRLVGGLIESRVGDWITTELGKVAGADQRCRTTGPHALGCGLRCRFQSNR